MRILLLQEERYLPTYGGAHKANRRLLEELVRRGHSCLAVCAAYHPDTSPAEFVAAMTARGVEVQRVSHRLCHFTFRGVAVDGLSTGDLAQRSAWIQGRIREQSPDLVLVSDDPRRYQLAAALAAAPDRVVFLVHNHRHLPFGPLAAQLDARQTELLLRVRAVLVMSRYSRDYVARHSGLAALPVALPVDGPEPAPHLGSPDNPFVTLVKPIAEKGVSLFLALADRFPGVDFAAVPTWGNSPDAAQLAALEARPNVHLLPPADDIGDVLKLTRVLLVPSLFPETFGLLVPEAMMRGVPVLASNAGALDEAKLGVDFMLPVRPMTDASGRVPPQDPRPWAATLGLLLASSRVWERCSRLSREAGLEHLARTRIEDCEELLGRLAEVPA
jgi:glycosyltransferase involved in cell wall biosynthesis